MSTVLYFNIIWIDCALYTYTEARFKFLSDWWTGIYQSEGVVLNQSQYSLAENFGSNFCTRSDSQFFFDPLFAQESTYGQRTGRPPHSESNVSIRFLHKN